MANFDAAYNAVIVPFEGGYASANTAASIGDSGGETYKGIARNYNPSWAGWALIDAYKAAHGVPAWNTYIPSAQLDQLVKDLYKSDYWDKNKLGSVNSQAIANLLMDISVNSGVGTAALTIQHVLGVTADGIIGSITLNAINTANQLNLLNNLVAYRLNWLQTYQAGKAYLSTLLDRTKSYLSGAADLVVTNKAIVIPIVLLLLGAGGYLLYKRQQE